MNKGFKKVLSVITAVIIISCSITAFAASSAGIRYDGSEIFEPVSGVTMTKTQGSVIAGKASDDAFYQGVNTGNPPVVHKCAYNPNDLYVSFDFYFKNRNDDIITIRTEPYTYEAPYKTIQFDINISPKNGVMLPSCAALPEEYSGSTVVPSEKVAKNEWHSISISFCCLDSKFILYFDGVKYEIPLNETWNATAGGEERAFSYFRRGVNNTYIYLYSARNVNAVDFDNISMLYGHVNKQPSALDANYENAELPGGHHGHLDSVETDSVKNVPVIASYDSEAVTGKVINIMKNSTASKVLSKIQTGEGCGKVRIYSDSAFTAELTGDSIVTEDCIIAVSAVNSENVERIYNFYSVKEESIFGYKQISETNTTLEITGFSAKLTAEDIAAFNGTTVEIPAKINGVDVTKISDYAFYTPGTEETPEVCYSEIDFVIPDTIGNIGQYAFKKSGITSLSAGTANVNTYYYYEAFSDCDKLASITFGPKFVGSRPEVFKDCDALTSVDMSQVNTMIWAPVLTGMFKNCNSLKEITVNKLPQTFIPADFVAGCSSLETIKFYDANIASKIFVAVYDEDQQMTEVSVPVKVNAEDETSVITIPAGDSVKLIQLDSVTSLVPSVSAIKIK